MPSSSTAQRRRASRSPAARRRPAPSNSGDPSPSGGTAAAAQKQQQALHKAEADEFGGPIGALATMVFLPLVIFALAFLCDEHECLGWPGSAGDWARALTAKRFSADLGLGACSGDSATTTIFSAGCTSAIGAAVWSNDALYVVVGWIALQIVLERVLPYELADGAPLPLPPSGGAGASASEPQRLRYRLNGHLAFWVSLLLMGHGWPTFDAATGALTGLGPAPLHWLSDNFVQLGSAAIAVSVALSVFLYAFSFRKVDAAAADAAPPLLARPGNTGIAVYDFFMGRELNPRLAFWKDFDLKFFCELRPGLIGWVVINLGCLMAQRRRLGYVSAEMAIVNVAQALYVWDALYFERAILTTMDITSDGFGFMLAFGDLAWVPFTYTLQARYLAMRDPSLPTTFLLGVCALALAGYTVFRGANGEKDAFRRDPFGEACRHLKWISTRRGRRLLISGWWGAARKINYTGDWMMGLSWCLCCGSASPVPYFYAIYFAILLVHRAHRDDHACSLKYGDDWQRYKRHVPSLFIPKVY